MRRLPCFPLTAIVIALAFCPIAAAGVCGEPHPQVCAEFFHSDAVFAGTVNSVRDWPTGDSGVGGWLYRLKVTKTYRGPVRTFIEVFTGNDSGRLHLENGHSYLLFACKQEGLLTIDNCGNSTELSEAADLIHQLETVLADIKSASGGDIRGRIILATYAMPVRFVVTATSGDKSYTGTTDEDGWFHIHVPPGEYAVLPEAPQWTITAYDLSYDDPAHVVIQHGSCAEVQFTASRQK